MKSHVFTVVFCFFLFLLTSPYVYASEVCSQLGGTCKEACGEREAPEAGAFEDCTDKQQCCIARDAESSRPQCCVLSFDPKHFGPSNCSPPENNSCPKGAGSPVTCSKLIPCK